MKITGTKAKEEATNKWIKKNKNTQPNAKYTQPIPNRILKNISKE